MADTKVSASSEKQVRLIIWSVPRSTSTVLSKCLSYVPESLFIFEPYANAHYFGPERAHAEMPNAELQERIKELKNVLQDTTPVDLARGFDADKCTYKWVQEKLEEAHTGKKFVLCKDMAFAISHKQEFIPNGYRHAFLVRHPLRALSSWKKLFRFFINMPVEAFELDQLPPQLFPKGCSFGELCEVYDHVKATYDQDAIVIDSDDLLRDPKGILSALFENIGLPFDEELLQWEAGDAVTEQWVASDVIMRADQLGMFYKTAFESTCFTKPSDLPDRSSISPDILRCVDASMPYYEKMYAQRLKPNEK